MFIPAPMPTIQHVQCDASYYKLMYISFIPAHACAQPCVYKRIYVCRRNPLKLIRTSSIPSTMKTCVREKNLEFTCDGALVCYNVCQHLSGATEAYFSVADTQQYNTTSVCIVERTWHSCKHRIDCARVHYPHYNAVYDIHRHERMCIRGHASTHHIRS